MADRNPGEPLNSSNMPQNQGICPTETVPSYLVFTSPSYIGGFNLFQRVFPIEKGNYNSKDIPFQKMCIDYKP